MKVMLSHIFIGLFSKKNKFFNNMAGVTGLEPATSCVTGRRSNQAELHPHIIMVGSKGLEPLTPSV